MADFVAGALTPAFHLTSHATRTPFTYLVLTSPAAFTPIDHSSFPGARPLTFMTPEWIIRW